MKTIFLLLIVVLISIGCDGPIPDSVHGNGNTAVVVPQLNPILPDNYNTIVSIVDENGDPFQATALSWGFANDNNPNKFEVECEYDTCTQWELGFEVEGSISMRTWGYIPTDKYCSKHYEGETEIVVDPNMKQNIELKVQYFATACT